MSSRVVGSVEDCRVRLRLALPARWFADDAPVLDGVLTGLAAGWAGLYGLLGVVRAQSRLATATGAFLDLAGQDFFGRRLLRRGGEADAAYRGRVQAALRRVRGTRAGVIDAAAAAGGVARVFEPARPLDTGVYGGAGLGWGVAGGWGSLAMPLECLVVVSGGVEAEVVGAVAEAMPAGGAAWVRVG